MLCLRLGVNSTRGYMLDNDKIKVTPHPLLLIFVDCTLYSVEMLYSWHSRDCIVTESWISAYLISLTNHASPANASPAVLPSDWPHRLGLRVLPLVSGAAWKSTPKVVDSPSFCSPTPPSFRQPHPFAGSAPVHFQSSKWPVVPRDATATARTRCVV